MPGTAAHISAATARYAAAGFLRKVTPSPRITRALGTEPELCTDYNTVDFLPGSKILICTDGLSNYITDEELQQYCREYEGDGLTEKLIETAKVLGGSDNITVAVIEN